MKEAEPGQKRAMKLQTIRRMTVGYNTFFCTLASQIALIKATARH